MSGSESPKHAEEAPSLSGVVFTPSSQEELFAALEQAFDYRGDVTLELRSGATASGYLFNRVFAGDAFVDVLPQADTAKLRIPCADIRTIQFTGRDMASGRSWDAWVMRWNAKKAAVAEGRDIGSIEPIPTHIDE